MQTDQSAKVKRQLWTPTQLILTRAVFQKMQVLLWLLRRKYNSQKLSLLWEYNVCFQSIFLANFELKKNMSALSGRQMPLKDTVQNNNQHNIYILSETIMTSHFNQYISKTGFSAIPIFLYSSLYSFASCWQIFSLLQLDLSAKNISVKCFCQT